MLALPRTVWCAARTESLPCSGSETGLPFQTLPLRRAAPTPGSVTSLTKDIIFIFRGPLCSVRPASGLETLRTLALPFTLRWTVQTAGPFGRGLGQDSPGGGLGMQCLHLSVWLQPVPVPRTQKSMRKPQGCSERGSRTRARASHITRPPLCWRWLCLLSFGECGRRIRFAQPLV